jgi:aminoglycoside 6'-N-acetyltransferase
MEPASIRGEQVVLRPRRSDDVARLNEIGRHPEVSRWWPPDDDSRQAQLEGRDECTGLAIEADGRVVGLIQYCEEEDPEYRHAGIDIFLDPQVHGRGLGTDAVRTLARWLVSERGHHRLTIDPAADNPGAIRAYEKAGFKRIGLAREYWRNAEGVWHDGVLMDLLARELD